ncbi:MAG: hypothetical protein U1E04_04650 [Hylemonella sp.]|nr:hypothetical protein [Hylemonella sp.]
MAANGASRKSSGKHSVRSSDGTAVAAGSCAVGPQVDAGDAQGVQGLELTLLAHAVLVQVAPNAQFRVGGVGDGDLTVGITVERTESGKAVGGGLAVGQQGLVAEEFAAGVDGAVAIQIANEHAVVGADPLGAGADAVGIVVEENVAIARSN